MAKVKLGDLLSKMDDNSAVENMIVKLIRSRVAQLGDSQRKLALLIREDRAGAASVYLK